MLRRSFKKLSCRACRVCAISDVQWRTWSSCCFTSLRLIKMTCWSKFWLYQPFVSCSLVSICRSLGRALTTRRNNLLHSYLLCFVDIEVSITSPERSPFSGFVYGDFWEFDPNFMKMKILTDLWQSSKSSQNELWKRSRVQNGSPRSTESKKCISRPIPVKLPAESARYGITYIGRFGRKYGRYLPENMIFGFFGPRRPILHPRTPTQLILRRFWVHLKIVEI